MEATFNKPRYLGGYSKFEEHREPHKKWGDGVLRITDSSITIELPWPFLTRGRIEYSTVRSVQVFDRGQVAKSKIAAVVAFGVLGGLAAKGAMDQAALAVRTIEGETAYFEIDGESVVKVKAKVEPVLKLAGVSMSDDLLTEPNEPSEPSEPSLANQIRELAALRDEGLLSSEEYEEAKAKLLGAI